MDLTRMARGILHCPVQYCTSVHEHGSAHKKLQIHALKMLKKLQGVTYLYHSVATLGDIFLYIELCVSPKRVPYALPSPLILIESVPGFVRHVSEPY